MQLVPPKKLPRISIHDKKVLPPEFYFSNEPNKPLRIEMEVEIKRNLRVMSRKLLKTKVIEMELP